MLSGARVLLLNVAACYGVCLCAAAQDGISSDSIGKLLTSPDLKGTLAARTTKEVWTGADGQSRLTVYTIGDYELRLVQFPEGSGFGVFQGDDQKTAAMAQPGTSSPELLFEPSLGLDVDQDGAPDAVVGWHTGGMHCCFIYQVYSFAQPFRAGATLDGGGAPLELVSGSSPNVVFRATDGVLGYWHSDFASSIFSDVYIQVNGDAVSFAEAWMKHPAPSDEEWARMKAEVAAAFASREGWMKDPVNGEPPFAPRALIQQMVTLIYNGNGAHALRLLRETWRGDASRSGAVAAELLGQIANSGYWESIRALNGWTGEPAAIAQAELAAN